MTINHIVEFRDIEEVPKDIASVQSTFNRIRPNYFARRELESPGSDLNCAIDFITKINHQQNRLEKLFYLVADYYARAEIERKNQTFDPITQAGYSTISFHDFTHTVGCLMTLRDLVSDQEGNLLVNKDIIEYSAAALLLHDISLLSVHDMRDADIRGEPFEKDQKLGHELNSYFTGRAALEKAGYGTEGMEIETIHDDILATQWFWNESFQKEPPEGYHTKELTLGMYLTKLSDLFETLGAKSHGVSSNGTTYIVAEREDIHDEGVARSKIYTPRVVERTTFFMIQAYESLTDVTINSNRRWQARPYLKFISELPWEAVEQQNLAALEQAGRQFLDNVGNNIYAYLTAVNEVAPDILTKLVIQDDGTPMNKNTVDLYRFICDPQRIRHNPHITSK